MLTADKDDDNDSESLSMIDILVSIVHSKINCCRAWLKHNEHDEKDFSVKKMMQIINEDMKEAD